MNDLLEEHKELHGLKKVRQEILKTLPEEDQKQAALEEQFVEEFMRAPNSEAIQKLYFALMEMRIDDERAHTKTLRAAADAIMERDGLISSYAAAFEKLMGCYPGQKELQRN